MSQMKDKDKEKTYRGPYGYPRDAMLRAVIAMRLLNMNGFTHLVERLTYDVYFRYICGFEPFGEVPCVSTFSRFYAELAASNILERHPHYFVMDAAYDDNSIYELIQKEYQAQAVIPLNRRNAKQPKAGYDWDGTPVCSAGYQMVYWGSSGGKNKFRCPHILGKQDCPFGSAWCSESNYGMVVKTSVKDDPRLFTVPHRGTKNWNRIYNLRTFAERCFARFKENLGLETGLKLRRYDKVKAHAYLCAVAMYAAVIAVNQRSRDRQKLAG